MKKCLRSLMLCILSTNSIHTMQRVRLMLQRLSADISPTTQKNINLAQAQIPAAVLERYQKDCKVSDPQKALHVRDEWIRFALLAKTTPTSLAMFSKEVDDFWHTFILFTKAYEEFFKTFPAEGNGTMLHHNPHETSETCPQKCQFPLKETFITHYTNRFGEDPRTKTIWRGLSACKVSCCLPVPAEQTTAPHATIAAAALAGTLAAHHGGIQNALSAPGAPAKNQKDSTSSDSGGGCAAPASCSSSSCGSSCGGGCGG